MKRWLKWIGLGLAVLALLGVSIIAVLAWRITRVPAWYTQALNVPQWPADVVEKQQLIPLQNWLAKMSAGNLGARSESERRHTIELTEDQLNALLAKWTDNLHGDVEAIRVKFQPDGLALHGTWTAQARNVGLNMRCVTDADGVPRVVPDGLFLGDQIVPQAFVLRSVLSRLDSAINEQLRAGKAFGIDEHDIASKPTARLFYARAGRAIVAGTPVGPNFLLSPSLSLDDAVAVRVTQLRVEQDRLMVELQMLDAAQRAEWVEEIRTGH